MQLHRLALLGLIGLVTTPAAAAAEGNTPALYRCEQTVTTPTGEGIALQGWGGTEACARAQALRVARIVSQLHFGPELWNGLMFGAGERREFTGAALLDVPPDAVLRTPGYRTEAGVCAPQELPAAGGAWTATWPLPTDETAAQFSAAQPATAGDPATALEATRRRTCLAAYKAGYGSVFDALAAVAPEQRAEMLGQATDELLAHLTTCYTAPPPALTPADSGPAPAAAAAGAGEVYQCTAQSGGPDPHPVAVGWGDDLELAVEAALQESAYTIPHRALALGLHASAQAAPEQRITMLASALEESMDVVAASDLADRARLRCQRLTAPAAGTLSWSPADPRLVAECNLDDDPASAVVVYDRLDVWPQTHQELCAGHLLSGVALVHEAAAHAPSEMRDPLTAQGWGYALACENSCLADLRVVGASATPVPVPGLPDRSSSAAAAALLECAIAERDLDLLILLAPVMDDPRLRRQVSGDPDRFWNELLGAREKGQFEQMFVWKEIDGAWTLVPPR